MKILFIDGPMRGELTDIGKTPMPLVIVDPEKYGPSETLNQITYYRHRFSIGGREVNLASANYLAEDIDPDDVFDLVVSDKAKEAAVQ